MSERPRAETHDEVIKWVEQLRDDIQRGDWNTAYEESLPIVAEAVANRAGSGLSIDLYTTDNTDTNKESNHD